MAFEHEADFFKGFDYKKMMADQKIRVAPGYGCASSFQGPRTARLGIHFSFSYLGRRPFHGGGVPLNNRSFQIPQVSLSEMKTTGWWWLALTG